MRAEFRRFFRLSAEARRLFTWAFQAPRPASSAICALFLIPLSVQSLAFAADVCLLAPRMGEPVWVRDEEGNRTNETLPSRTLAQINDTSRASENTRFVQFFINGEAQGWVSASVVRPPEHCLASMPPSSPTEPPPHQNQPPESSNRPAPLPDSSISQSTDPFNCSTSRAQDQSNCNKEEIRNYAVQGKHNFSYDQAREELFQVVDVIEDNQGREIVSSLYSKETIQAPSRGMPDSSSFNTEHVFPQSRLRKNSQTFSQSRTDLFHLFACSSWINSKRSSLPFANIAGGTPVDESKMTDSNFEPPNRSKGKVARAMMYIALVYQLSIDTREEQTLRAWHKDYPVSSVEVERSARVTELQGNRNPFVDHPEWSDLISDF